MAKATYHHGEVREACVRAAIELLEDGGETALSLRAVARQVGVSPAAPYRHYADREALVSAVAAVGYRDPGAQVGAGPPSPPPPPPLAPVAIASVQFPPPPPAFFPG